MKKGINKIIAGLLVLMMILAMVPSFAFADEGAADGAAPGISDAGNEGSSSGEGGEAAPQGTGISGVDENGASTMSLFPDLGGEGSDVPMIGYSKFVYIVGADIGEGAETWAKINVVKEDAAGNRVQLAHGAFPVGLSLVNGMTVTLTPYAREHYTIKDIEGDHAIITFKDVQSNYSTFSYYTMHVSFTHTLTIVLDGEGGGEAPDVPEDKICLYYLSEGKVIDSECAAPTDGKASFVLKDAPAREGYQFLGWDYNGTAKQPGETLELTESSSVTALWKENGGGDVDPNPPAGDTVKLTYDINGGQGGPAVNPMEYKRYFVAPLNAAQPDPTHADAEGVKVLFMGWKTEQHPVLKRGDAPVYADLTVLMDSDKTVYALYGLDDNNNNIPDVYEINATLSYNETMGVAGSGPADKTDCALNSLVEVDYENEPVPSVGNIVFLYWTDEVNALKFNVSKHVFGDNYTPEIMPDKITSIKMYGNRTLYAVWAYDNNGDDIPDFNQKQVEVKYDPNKGVGGPGTDTVVVTKGTSTEYSLKNEPKPTHAPAAEGTETVPVLFAGWTTAAVEEILERGDKLPESLVAKLTIPYESEGETVYALWGYDRDNSGIPDVLEHEYTLTYDDNGGHGGPGAVKVMEQKGYKLEDTKLPTCNPIVDGKLVFYSWSLSRHILPLTASDKGDLPDDLVKTIDIDGDKTVYAVWALDKNGNNIPDVDEDTYTLTFDVNGGVEGSGPKPIDKLLAGEKVNLKLVLPRPIHEPAVEGENKVPVVLAGWTDAPVTGILDKNSPLPAGYYTDELTMPAADKTVYAIYGYDRNHDGEADVNQTLVHLTYDPNGGEGGPGIVEYAKGSIVTPDRKNIPTHNPVDDVNVVFAYWSEVKAEDIYDVGDEAPEKCLFIALNNDSTLYAVYGYDRDGNGVPDINEYEKVFTLSFDPNGGLTAPDAQKAYSKNGKEAYINITEELPTHEKLEFKGWATTPDGKPSFRPGQRVKLESDVTLYAVWGEKGSGGGGGIPGFGGGGGKPGTTPKTGDESSLGIWAGIALVSMMGIGAVAVNVKRRKDN